METQTQKTNKIIIIARQWLDRKNGNTYFSVWIELENTILFIPFNYGYDDAYLYASIEKLQKNNIIPSSIKTMYELKNYCKDNNIVLFTSLQKNCLKKELKHLVTNNHNIMGVSK